MRYAKGEVRDGQLILTSEKEIDQSQLNSDCLLIQFEGLIACKTCEVRGRKDCGGGRTLKRLNQIEIKGR